jgi:thiamine transport system ATP-binding protein
VTAALTVSNVTVYYGDRLLLDRVRLAVQPDEVVCLLGPSGSGKSTLLQVVAGLQVPASGRICWYDEDLTAVPTHRRGFGLVFQDPLLFPHLDVGRNVAYGLRAAGTPRAEAAARVEELLTLCLLYTSPSPRDRTRSRMPSSA